VSDSVTVPLGKCSVKFGAVVANGVRPDGEVMSPPTGPDGEVVHQKRRLNDCLHRNEAP